MTESRSPARPRVVLGLGLFLLFNLDAQAQGARLTGGAQLAAAYDAIFDARFDDVPALLTAACGNVRLRGFAASSRQPSPGTELAEPHVGAPKRADLDEARPKGERSLASAQPAPPEACQLLDVVAIWWRIQLDPNNRSRDDEFRTRVDAAIAAIDTWTMREPMRAEAWFYLGGAYGARAQWRVLRGERLSAARDGKRIKESLERALDLDPAMQDAYFGIGLYHYYAAVAPAAARFLRFLLLLPGGDRVKGLDEMLRAREGGQLLRSEADYQLHLIYLWYEKRTDRALELLHALHARHPRNPHFLQSIATIEDVYLHDSAGSIRTWQQMLDAARAGRLAEPAIAETTARLGLARELDTRGDTEAAMAHLREVIERRPAAPFGALARAQLQLGQVLDHRGQRSEAVAAYRAALDLVPPGDPDRIAPQARAGMRATHVR